MKQALFTVSISDASGSCHRVGSRGNSRASTCSPSKADASASVRADSTGAMNWIVWRRNRVSIATWGAAAIGVALVLSGSSFVCAIRVAPDKRSQLASPETAGSFGEVIRGPRGKSQIAFTFDAERKQSVSKI